MKHVAVVGAGIVGTLTALLAARDGARVTLLERAEAAWTGASAINEGKVHLGPVFALDDAGTWDPMLRAALAFRRVVDTAAGRDLDWERLRTRAFDYLVRPDSMLDVDELQSRYRAIEARLDALAASSGRDYLGEDLPHLLAGPARPGAAGTIVPTLERGVDPELLGRELVAALDRESAIALRTRCEVRAVRDGRGRTELELADGSMLDADAVILANWEGQESLMPAPARRRRNYRVKSAAIVDRALDVDAVTIVQGPYGDVVPFADRTFVSWYPVGRLAHEHGTEPSAHARELVAAAPGRRALGDAQLAALADLGLIPPGLAADRVVAGFIVGDGELDIDDPRSRLHGRREFGVRRSGRILAPSSFKFTTGPLAAELTAEALATVLEDAA